MTTGVDELPKWQKRRSGFVGSLLRGEGVKRSKGPDIAQILTHCQ